MALRLVSSIGSACDWCEDFLRHLLRQYEDLHVTPPACVYELVGGPELPELLMVFAPAPWNANAAPPDFLEALRGYARNAQRLLPVLDDATHARSHLPEDLQGFHAFLRAIHGKIWPYALVDEVLTLVWQRRRKRKIFISYMRGESAAIARQLADRYQRLSFEVFHDERSIRPGENYPRVIDRGIDDSDAVLVLVSPGLTASATESASVRAEVQRAMNRQIGLLGIIWPPNRTSNPAGSSVAAQVPEDLCLQLAPTEQADGPERVLTESELAAVDRLLYLKRTLPIAERVRNLTYGATQLSDFTVTEWRNDGDLELSRNGERWLGCVFASPPELTDLESCWEQRCTGPTRPAGVVAVYPAPGAGDDDERHAESHRECEEWGRSRTPPLVLKPVPL